MKADAFRDQVVIVTGASAGIDKALADLDSLFVEYPIRCVS
jgi:NADP-dependent 3-hydroxy acid dehydrogenase YdfG